MPRPPQVMATSGGFRWTPRGPARGGLFDAAVRLADTRRARVCYLGTAAGDRAEGIAGFYTATGQHDDVDPSHLALFPMPSIADVRAHLLAQDLVWVGGGSVANLLAVWRLHRVDEVLREAWAAGVVLAGVSAGSICWHVGGPTDSFGPDLRPVTDGLGLLPFGNGVHYDSEEQRRPLLHRLVGDGTLPTSYATDDGVALHYVGTTLSAVLSERDGAAAYVVRRGADGSVVETRLEPTPA